MSILADWEIRELCLPEYGLREGQAPMLSPFDDGTKKLGRISSGLSIYGYDIRLGTRFKVFTNIHGGVIDPKDCQPKHLFDMEGNYCDIPPNAYILGESVERFCMPFDVMALVVGKSTYARVGVLVNVTPVEGGWSGILTIEIANLSPLPVRTYANEGIAQCVFFRGRMPLKNYLAHSGTYQDQTGLTLAKVAQ